MKSNHIVFSFYRDGSINTDFQFLPDPGELKHRQKSSEAIHVANASHLKVSLVASRSEIAQGVLTEKGGTSLHRHPAYLWKKRRAHVDAITSCRLYPEYRKESRI